MYFLYKTGIEKYTERHSRRKMIEMEHIWRHRWYIIRDFTVRRHPKVTSAFRNTFPKAAEYSNLWRSKISFSRRFCKHFCKD